MGHRERLNNFQVDPIIPERQGIALGVVGVRNENILFS
jgi:hypothetical protein